MSGVEIGLPEALERAASALPRLADEIRPANGDPGQLARGLDTSAASAVLVWLLEHEPGAGAELALAWAEDPATAGPVLDLAPDELPKAARKVLRRARHRLRSRGVAVPEPAPAPTVAKLAHLDEAVDEARITGLDPHGVRLVYLAVDRAAGGVRLFELALDGTRGVLEFDVFEAGRARARRFLRETERRESWPTVAAPSDSVRVLIARAARCPETERTPPRAFAEWRTRLCEVAPDTPTPGALAAAALGGADELDLDTVCGWLREGGVGPWPPPLDRVRPLIERLDEIAEGQLVVSGAAREEQVERAVDDAVPEIYDAGQRARCAEAFGETAYVWWKRGREADARQALAAAAALGEGAAAADRLARTLLETLLAPAVARAREGKPKQAEPAGDAAAPGSGEAP